MNEKKLVHNFKSYLGLDSPTFKNNKNGAHLELTPKLLTGELIVGAAHNVLMCTPLSEREQGKIGSLFVTNYKLSFVTPDPAQNEESNQRNLLLGPNDIPLGNVGAVWLTDVAPVRHRRLVPYGPMPSKVKGIQIICKNLKVMTFSFRQSLMGQGRTIAVSLLHHAFPKRHHLLFAYDYREQYYPTLPSDMNMFYRASDWKRELERTECPEWRTSCVNGTSDAFAITACETLVVPSSVVDCRLVEHARHFRAGRLPVWVWGVREGAALLRCGELLPTEQAALAESVTLEQVRKSHPWRKAPKVLYLCGTGGPAAGVSGAGVSGVRGVSGAGSSGVLPSLDALKLAYKKLAEVCTPATLRAFWEQDSQFYSSLERSKWLQYVSSCLLFADEAAQLLSDNTTVVLQEGDGIDYSAVVSCLVQLLMDPHSRTISGFQSLIQKEWLALGHPFCDRLGHLAPTNPKDKEPIEVERHSAPVFLLFLDATWQLLQQFPADFQFSSTYLTTLWDAVHNQIFDTFLFNCPRDRELAATKNLILRPVWDWGEQFHEQDLALFYNPLYTPLQPASKTNTNCISSPMRHSIATTLPRSATTASSVSASAPRRLLVSGSVSSLQLWSQCYERWLSPLDLPAAGDIQYYIHNSVVLKQIQGLRDQISLSTPLHSTVKQINGRKQLKSTGTQYFKPTPRPLVSAFYPFTASGGRNLASCASLDALHVGPIDSNELADIQSLINAPD